MIVSVIHLVLGLAMAPLLMSVINRTKALFAGRVGQPWLQPYFDLWKLLHKGAVYSETTTWIFRAGPMVGLAAVLTALLLLPFGGGDAVFRFEGDLIVFVYFLGMARLATVLAALDTGSSFEGMGASREVWVSSLAEPALLLALAAVAREAAGQHPLQASLSFLHEQMTPTIWARTGLVWVLAALLVGVVLPARTGLAVVDDVIALAGVFGVTVAVGVIESVIARLRLVRIPQLLIGASSLAALACVLVLQKERGSP
jgi:formate hydrogenlyase subunit 4